MKAAYLYVLNVEQREPFDRESICLNVVDVEKLVTGTKYDWRIRLWD